MDAISRSDSVLSLASVWQWPFWAPLITLLSGLALHLIAGVSESASARAGLANLRRRIPGQSGAWRLQPAGHSILSAVRLGILIAALSLALWFTARPVASTASGLHDGTALLLQRIVLGLGTVFLVVQLETSGQRPAAVCTESGWILCTLSGLLTLSVTGNLVLLIPGLLLVSFSILGLSHRLRAGPGGHRSSRTATQHGTAAERIGLFRMALATSLALYGIALLAVGSGQVQLLGLHDWVSQQVRAGAALPLLDVGSVLLVCGLAVQAGLPPFHFGREEAVADLRWWSSGWIELSGGLASLIVLVRLATLACPGLPALQMTLVTLATTALTVGNLRILHAARLERVVSGLIIISLGYALVPLAFATWSLQPDAVALTFGVSRPEANPVAVLWVTTQSLSLGGLCAVLACLESAATPVRFDDDLRGLLTQRPLAAFSAAVCLVSLAGLPPSVGFWSRWLLILSVQSAQFESPLVLAFTLVLGLNLVLTAAACLRVISVMLTTRPLRHVPAAQRPAALLAGLCVAGVLLAWGWSPGVLLRGIWQPEPRAAGTELTGKSLK